MCVEEGGEKEAEGERKERRRRKKSFVMRVGGDLGEVML